MRKILILSIISILLFNSSYAKDNSSNAFKIYLEKPQNNIINDKSSGLDSSEITAITLGSIFGGLVLAGVARYYYKKGIVLSCCHIKSKISALIPICFNKKVKKKYDKKINKYLMKILDNENLDETCKKKYILVEDEYVANKTYNRFYFKLDKNYSKITLYQYSDSYKLSKNLPNLDTRIFKNNDLEIPMRSIILDADNGKLIKKTSGSFLINEYYYVDSSLLNNTNGANYALVLEFEM